MTYHFAELNIGRIHAPLDSAEMAEFQQALDAINMIAERTPGFVWRLRDDEGQSSSYVPVFDDDPLMIVNFSVWEDVESLKHFMFKSGHAMYLRRRREWFEAPTQPHLVCWWVPAGEIPTIEEAVVRLEKLRANGPTAEAFTLNELFPAPGDSPGE